MSATRPTEFRTPSELQMQARLERVLAARRAADAAREARIRTLPTPSMQPVLDDDSPILTMCLEVLAGLLLWALFGYGVIAVIAWWQS